MRRFVSFITLCLGMVALSFAQEPDTIFNPATFEGEFPGGTIVEIDGESYLKVVVDGWNNSFSLPVGVPLGSTISAKIKYAKGNSELPDAEDVNINFQVADPNNTVPASWDPSTMVPTSTAVTVGKAAADFTTATASVPKEMDYGITLQVSVQEKFGSWGARTNDTVWVGAMTTEGYDHILFDPANLDPEALADGFEIDTVNGGLYLKATVDGWNTNFDIPEVSTGTYNKVIGNLKYEEGTSGVVVANSNSFMQFMPGQTGNLAAQATEEFTRVIAGLTPGLTVNSIQIAAQNTADGWSAIVGADVYVGRIKAFTEILEKATPPETYTVYKTNEDIVLDGIIDDAYFAHDIWDTIKKVSLGSVGSIEAGENIMVDAGAGSFAEWTAICDMDYMYVYVEVEDNDLVHLGSSTSYWENDGLELFIDGLDRRYVGEDRNGGGGQNQLRINIDEGVTGSKGVFSGSGLFMNPEGTAPLDNDTIKIKFANIVSSSGYSMEIAIPWAAFFINSSNTIAEALAQAKDSLKDGTQMALELSLIDADATDHRVSILSWANPTGEDKSYTTAEYWGQFTLAGFSGNGVNNAAVSNRNLVVYPNPVSSVLTIDMENVAKAEIISITGAKVLESNILQNQINVSQLKSGIYLIKAFDVNGEYSVAKFTKK